MIPDQKKMWNNKYAKKPALTRENEPSSFATKVLPLLSAKDNLLELGCGTGLDSRLFAQNGTKTLATDFSADVIHKNKAQNHTPKLTFEVLDMTDSFPFSNNSFSAVYAHLSLHYFTEADTLRIFGEIHRVLKHGGLLAFRCKSTNDPTNGLGVKIEDNMFVLKDHVRHLFTPQYTKKLIKGKFTIIQLQETSGLYAGKTSHFIDCVARKI